MDFRGIVYVLVLNLGDGYTGFHFIMLYTVVEAAIMGLATSLWDCLISALSLELSFIRDTAVHWAKILLPYLGNTFPCPG